MVNSTILKFILLLLVAFSTLAVVSSRSMIVEGNTEHSDNIEIPPSNEKDDETRSVFSLMPGSEREADFEIAEQELSEEKSTPEAENIYEDLAGSMNRLLKDNIQRAFDLLSEENKDWKTPTGAESHRRIRRDIGTFHSLPLNDNVSVTNEENQEEIQQTESTTDSRSAANVTENQEVEVQQAEFTTDSRSAANVKENQEAEVQQAESTTDSRSAANVTENQEVEVQQAESTTEAYPECGFEDWKSIAFEMASKLLISKPFNLNDTNCFPRLLLKMKEFGDDKYFWSKSFCANREYDEFKNRLLNQLSEFSKEIYENGHPCVSKFRDFVMREFFEYKSCDFLNNDSDIDDEFSLWLRNLMSPTFNASYKVEKIFAARRKIKEHKMHEHCTVEEMLLTDLLICTFPRKCREAFYRFPHGTDVITKICRSLRPRKPRSNIRRQPDIQIDGRCTEEIIYTAINFFGKLGEDLFYFECSAIEMFFVKIFLETLPRNCSKNYADTIKENHERQMRNIFHELRNLTETN